MLVIQRTGTIILRNNGKARSNLGDKVNSHAIDSKRAKTTETVVIISGNVDLLSLHGLWAVIGINVGFWVPTISS